MSLTLERVDGDTSIQDDLTRIRNENYSAIEDAVNAKAESGDVTDALALKQDKAITIDEQATTVESAIQANTTRITATELQSTKNANDVDVIQETINKLATSEDEIEDSGIAGTSISKQALNGACKVLKSGKSFTNLVSGQDIANEASVTFESVLDNIYYDSLNNTFLTGTGSTMTVTNDTGDVADIMVFDLTAEGHTALTADEVLAYNPVYHEGTQHTDGKGCVCSSNKNLFDIYKYYNLYSNYDFIGITNYRTKKIRLRPLTTYTVKGYGDYDPSVIMLINSNPQVNASAFFDFRSLTSKTFTTDEQGYLYIGVFPPSSDSLVNSRLNDISIQLELSSTTTDYIEHVDNDFYYDANHELRSNTETADTIEEINGKYFYVQRVDDTDNTTLAEPTYTEIETVGVPQAYQAGQTLDLPYDVTLFKHDGNDVSTPNITELLELEQFDPTTGVSTELDVNNATIGVDSFISTDLVSGEWYTAKYAYTRYVEGDITVTTRNNNKYKIDTATSDTYKVEIIVTNGVPSLQATLV